MKTKETNRRRIISRTKWFRRELAVIFSLYFICANVAFANPYGAQIVNGNVSMSTQGNILNITNSPNSIINWQGFSIAANEMTRFNQQNSASAVLNRIVGQNPSAILGALQSNGKVFLINPNGVLFGQGARIEVNGLVASTLNLSNQDFLAGKYNFTAGLNPGSIKNQGSILTPNGGQVYLIAPDIENTGIINSPKGDIILAAGHSVNLVDSADPFISVVVSAPADKAVNLGQIVAQSGRIGIYGGLIKQSSIVNADSAVVGEGGKILFKASKEVTLDPGSITSAKGGGTIGVFADMQNGTVNVAGTLDASAPNGGNGGAIETSAANVKIADTAHIATLAPYGKSGSWLIDPNDFTIAASGGDMTGATLSSNLGTTDVTILSSSGATAGNGDIFVNDAVSWATNHSLTLSAYRDVVVNSPISNTLAGPSSFIIVLQADSTGTGSGTVSFGGSGHVSFAAGGSYGSAAIFYNPPGGYQVPTDYSGNFSLNGATLTAYMLVNDVNSLQAMNTNLTGSYALGKNVDASATSGWSDGAGFAPVGSDSEVPFTGIFSGNNYIISGLYINRPATSYAGLFGYVNNGQIYNTNLQNSNVTGLSYVGGLAGKNTGSIVFSSSTGLVTGSGNNIGGLVGENYGSIMNSYSTGVVTGGGNNVGGLVGHNFNAFISNLYSAGSVQGASNVGGLVGFNDSSSIMNSYSLSAVNGTDPATSGGLVGNNGSTSAIDFSYSTGSVIGTTASGLVGTNIGSVLSSFWDTSTSGQATSAGGTGKTTAEMMTQTTFTSAVPAWSFANTWWMSDTNTRPILRSEYSTMITNPHQLQLVLMNLAASYILASDIDMAGLRQASGLWDTTKGFVPLGNDNLANPVGNIFTGTFDGAGHTVTGLYINRPATPYVGMFGGSDGNAAFRNIGLVNVDITGGFQTGGLVAHTGGTINNAFTTGTVHGTGNTVGGLVGLTAGSVNNSYSTAAVTGNTFVGGLVGALYFVAGIPVPTITNSYSAGAVSGSSSVGGLVGSNTGTVTNSYWDTQTSGQASSAGGTGKTTAQMKQQATFVGWDFANTWSIAEGQSYPYLTGQYHQMQTSYTLLFKADDKTKIFGDPNPVFTSTITGYAAGDTATTAFTGFPSYALSGEDVGTQTITVSIGTLASAVQGKYTFTFAPGLMTISPKILSIVTAALTGTASKTYDGTTTAILSPGNFLLSGFVNGDSATVTKTTGTYATKNVGSGIEVSTSLASSDFSPAGSTNLSNYTLPAGASGNIGTITPATLLVTGITAQNKVYDATTGAAISTGSATLAGIIGSDVVSMNGGSGAFTDKNVGAGKLVKVSGITLSGPDAGNYTINTSTASLSATADITKAPLTVTADDKTRIYGDANPAFTGRLSGFVGGETEGSSGVTGAAVYTTSASESSNAGAYSIIPGAGTLTAGNYSFASLVNGTLTVGRAPLSIIADDKVKLSGTPNPAFTVTHAGFKLGQNESVLGGVLSFATEATTASPEGTYKITPSGRTSDNYSITFVDGVLTVNPGEAVQQQQNSVLVAAINSAGKPTETVINMETRPGSDEEKDKDKTGGSSTTQEGQNSETKKQSLPYCN